MRELNLDISRVNSLADNLTDEGFLKIWLGVSDVSHPLVYAKDGGKIQVELIDSDELFKQDSLNTIVGKSICIGHPKDPVTSKNHKQYEVGTILQESRDNNGVLEVAAIIKDEDTIKRVLDKELRYTSMGYYADKEPISGRENYLKQRNRRYNHCSLLSKDEIPRAGLSSKILNIDDSNDISGDIIEKQNDGKQMSKIKDLINTLETMQSASLKESDIEKINELIDSMNSSSVDNKDSSTASEPKEVTEAESESTTDSTTPTSAEKSKQTPKITEPQTTSLPSNPQTNTDQIDQVDLIAQITEKTGNEIAARVELLTNYGNLLEKSSYNTDSISIKEEILRSQLKGVQLKTPEQINGAFEAWELMYKDQQVTNMNVDSKTESSNSYLEELVSTGLVVNDEARKKYIEQLNSSL